MTDQHDRQNPGEEHRDPPPPHPRESEVYPDDRPEAAPEAPPPGGPEALRADAPPAEERDQPAHSDSQESQAMIALREERDELFARLQRMAADYQNYTKRADQRLADAVDLARGDVLKGVIPVLDHFDRALRAEPAGEDARSLAHGMAMVRDELLKVLEHAGVQRIDVKPGEPFDPHRHEAMLRQPAKGVRPNHVAAAFEPGYVYKNRTLRPAKVAVAPEE